MLISRALYNVVISATAFSLFPVQDIWIHLKNLYIIFIRSFYIFIFLVNKIFVSSLLNISLREKKKVDRVRSTGFEFRRLIFPRLCWHVRLDVWLPFITYPNFYFQANVCRQLCNVTSRPENHFPVGWIFMRKNMYLLDQVSWHRTPLLIF